MDINIHINTITGTYNLNLMVSTCVYLRDFTKHTLPFISDMDQYFMKYRYT